jgi:hypothetical protein
MTLTIVLSIILFSCSNGQQDTKKSGAPITTVNSEKHELKTEIGKIKFDLTLTNFKPTTQMSNEIGKKYIYSLNGKDDLQSKVPISGFILAPLKFFDYKSAKKYVDDLTNDYGTDGGVIKRENIQKSEIEINKLKSYIITFQTVDESKNKCYVTLSILSNSQHSLLCWGSDFDNGIYSEKYINTIKSIEM